MQNSSSVKPHHLFSVFGIEIEYMIVQQDSLDISPYTDKLFLEIQDELTNEVERGEIALNNELALHVLELKTNGPKKDLLAIEQSFHHEIQSINQLLARHHLALMPTATHPWTNVNTIELWPHGDRAIYNAYHRIFNCHGHGWSNLQSTHINLPFADEDEFVQLHNAIRVLLPMIPALAASSPFCEGRLRPQVCSRMVHYEKNQKLIPSITGVVIPEWIKSYEHYHQMILQPMYQAIIVHDPEKILQEEWLNSRGAIARFERSAIEIRIVDSQESPLGDMMIVAAIVASLKSLMQRTDRFMTSPMDERLLKKVMDETVVKGLNADLDFKPYLEQIGLPMKARKTARDVWDVMVEHATIDSRYQQGLEHLLSKGNLAERLKQACKKPCSKQTLTPVYRELMSCLQENRLFAL